MHTTINGSSQSNIASLYSAVSLSKRLKDAQRHVNLDDSDMKEIINQYIKDTPVMVNNLNNAWINSNYENILLYAHSIVGVAHLLNLNEVGEYAKVIENEAKEKRHADKKALKLLNNHHNASLDALRRLY